MEKRGIVCGTRKELDALYGQLIACLRKETRTVILMAIMPTLLI
jgi:hypothetical protein